MGLPRCDSVQYISKSHLHFCLCRILSNESQNLAQLLPIDNTILITVKPVEGSFVLPDLFRGQAGVIHGGAGVPRLRGRG